MNTTFAKIAATLLLTGALAVPALAQDNGNYQHQDGGNQHQNGDNYRHQDGSSYQHRGSSDYQHQDGVNQRFGNQNRRIDNGVDSGQLNRHEQYQLQSREARMRSQEDRARSRDNGKLSREERLRLQREENRTSKSIYRDKHNDQQR